MIYDQQTVEKITRPEKIRISEIENITQIREKYKDIPENIAEEEKHIKENL